MTVDFAVQTVVAYPRATLHTTVLNLLSNAFKYTDLARPCRLRIRRPSRTTATRHQASPQGDG